MTEDVLNFQRLAPMLCAYDAGWRTKRCGATEPPIRAKRVCNLLTEGCGRHCPTRRGALSLALGEIYAGRLRFLIVDRACARTPLARGYTRGLPGRQPRRHCHKAKKGVLSA